MMKPLAIRRLPRTCPSCRRERGVTMVLVALALVAIIAMAALSIDIITLYLAREEAQRSADAAALAAARVISISGMTGDPSNSTSSWQAICGPPNYVATQVANAVVQQNAVGGTAIPTASISVKYSAGTGGASSTDCSSLPAAFAVNPMVTVQVTRAGLPTFFSRIWGNRGNTIGATSTAEAFNSSASDLNTNGGATGTVIPVQPSCVKPWVVPNLDPLSPSSCTNNCTPFVSTADGSIQRPGISQLGAGVIGETFWLSPDCRRATGSNCILHKNNTIQPQANYNANGNEPLPNLLYVPGQVGTPVVAIPSCSQGDPYEQAIEGCDSPTNYQCGVRNANAVDLRRNPGAGGTTTNGVQCLIHQTDVTDLTAPSGQDYFNPFGAPNTYPFQILAGSSNPLAGTLSGNPISSSTSIVSLPIYDNVTNIQGGATTDVTFIGYLQVFINAVDQNGNVKVTVLNVSGCGNGNTVPVSPNAVTSTSPVPIRLITPQ
jgi:hypothetical protein